MDKTTVCPKCSGHMIGGYITDFSMSRPVHAGVVSTWVEGTPPETSFWHGGAQIPADRCVPIVTFRCSNCGFLESYARSEFGAK